MSKNGQQSHVNSYMRVIEKMEICGSLFFLKYLGKKFNYKMGNILKLIQF